jgi:monoamine oxidase
VIVVEARDRVGGRILNHALANGGIVELGGWVGPTQDRVLALAADLGVELFPSYDAGDGLLSGDGEIVPFNEDTFGLAEEPRSELTAAMKALDDMALTVPLVEP